MTVRSGYFVGAPGAMTCSPLVHPGTYMGSPPAFNVAIHPKLGSWQFQILAGFPARRLHPMILIDAFQSTSITIPVFMRNANTDAGLPGLSTVMAVTSKPAGSAFGSISPTITDRGNGWYDLAFTSGMLATLGLMPLRITAVASLGQVSGQENDEITINVIAVNQYDGVRAGLTALPNANAGAVGGLAIAVIRGGTAQGPGTGTNQIQLDVGASSTNNLYNRHLLTIVSGTGAGQSRFIINYVGSTQTATLGRNWTTEPDSTSVYEITQASYNILLEGLAQGGAASSITFASSESAETNFYAGTWIHIISGTGSGQARLCTTYNGTTKVATTDTPWATAPDSTSGYQILTGADVTVGAQAITLTANANVTEWLGSTPNTLSSGLVQAIVEGTIVVADVNVTEWLGSTPAALDGSGNVPANIQAVGNPTAIAQAVLDVARSGHITLGTIGEGIALATSLLQGNFFIDNVTPSANGPTAQRLRCFLSATAMSGVTPGGTGQGEFATFLVATTYSGPGAVATHKVTQQ